MKEILDVIHKTIYQFFDVCDDDEKVPMSDKNKLLLEVNKAICDNLKELEQEPFMNKACVSSKVCEHDKGVVLDKIRAEIKKSSHGKWYVGRIDGKTEEVLLLNEVMQILDKYKAESKF